MKPQALLLAVITAIGITGFAAADNLTSVPADPDTALSLASERLALNPAQQDKLRPLLLQAIALRREIRGQGENLRAAGRVELGRPDADLRALSDERQALIAAELKKIEAMRQQFLAFYENELSPSQKARVRQLLLKRMDRFDRLRERMLAVADTTAFAP